MEGKEQGTIKQRLRENVDEDLSTNLNQMRLDGLNTDVLIVCKDKEFPAHKLVLSARSEFFKRMFSSDCLESKTNRVDLSYIDEHTLKDVLDYIYEPSAKTISERNIDYLLDIHSISHLLGITHLYDYCSELLVIMVNEVNCLDILSAIELCGSKETVEKIVSFTADNISRVVRIDSFYNLNKPILKSVLLKAKQHNASLMDYLLEAVIKWVKTDESNRLNYLTELFLCMNFDFISIEFVDEILEKHSSLFHNTIAKEFIQLQIQPNLKPIKVIQEMIKCNEHVVPTNTYTIPPINLLFIGNYTNFSEDGTTVTIDHPAAWLIDIENKSEASIKLLPFHVNENTLCTYCNGFFYFLQKDACNDANSISQNKMKFLQFDWNADFMYWRRPPVAVENAQMLSLHSNIYLIGRSDPNGDISIQVFYTRKQHWKTICTFHNQADVFAINAFDRICIFGLSANSSCKVWDIINSTVFKTTSVYSEAPENLDFSLSTVYKKHIYCFVQGVSGYKCYVGSRGKMWTTFDVQCNAATPMIYCFSTESEGIFFYNDGREIFKYDEKSLKIVKLITIDSFIKSATISGETMVIFGYRFLMTLYKNFLI